MAFLGKKFNCDECDRSYQTAQLLRQHKKYSHDGWINLISFNSFDIKTCFLFFSVDEISCNVCNKICRNRNRLKRHKQCHEGNLSKINSSNFFNDRIFFC